MLPKVATHIFHHTSRVAAAVQTQTTQVIRNAWQYQQSAPSGSSSGGGGVGQWGGVGSSSGWGGHSSADPGGAKYNAGSRFYSGSTGPGRSVTQANPTSAQPDDNDERTLHPVAIKATPVPARPRPRSTSLSLASQGHIDRGEELGVLKAVQLRARHAFAAHRSMPLANGPPVSPESMDLLALVRHNSTSTHSDISIDMDVDMSPPTSILEGSASSQSSIESDMLNPASPQSVTEPLVGDDDVATYERLRKAGQNHDIPKLLEEISRYRGQSRVSVPCYNMAMQGLYDNRAPGQPVSFILELYNEMLERNLIPNLRTYKTMILALCARDADVTRVIASLENRISRRDFTIRTTDENVNSLDKQRVAQLKTESNFTSALTLFQAATLVKNQPLGLPEYNALIRSCALHRNVQAALRIFAHMERFPEEPPSPVTYALLISVFCNTNDLGGAQQVFDDFKEASRQGKLAWDWTPRPQHGSPKRTGERNDLSRHSQIQVWNKMIETYFKCGEPAAALDLFETMLDTPRGQDFGEADAPLPNSITYTSIITGFCEAGDMQSALSWFDRLITQQAAAENPYAPLSTPPRPDHIAWIVMIDNLARTGNVDDLNRLFLKLMEFSHEDRLPVRIIDRHAVFRANLIAMEAPDVKPSRATALLDFVLTHVLNFDNDGSDLNLGVSATRNMLIEVAQVLKARGDYQRALDLVEYSVLKERKLIRQNEADGSDDGQQTLYRHKGLRNLVQTLSGIFLFPSGQSTPTSQGTPIKYALQMAALCEEVGIEPHRNIAPWYVYSYVEAKRLEQPLDLSLHDWELLFKAFVPLELPPMDPESSQPSIDIVLPPNFVSPGLASVLRDFAQTNFDMNNIDTKTARKIMRALNSTHGPEESSSIIRELGPRFAFLLELPGVEGTRGSGLQIGDSIPSQDPHSGGVHVDLYHSRFVEEWFPNNPEVSANTAFERFESGVKKGIYPSPECIGRLIGALGRLGEVDKVHTLYAAGQRVLAALEDQKRWQSAGWFVIEDQMVIAFAHAGEYDAAHVHRLRILDQGGTPSADAYGALISSLKETTDDTAHALQLWEEAMARDVRPNIFMYNTIISKLAKARKADHALQIFQQMKDQGIRPSSVTYGALIAACCRVGDVTSAELFFHEMSTSKNFKPRVPPYNTMIQLYTYTKPDRERVLYYYNALLDAGISPSPHTYKLLLDAYGTIQPVDTASMEQVFQRITESPRTEVQGTHWAALVSAYGCAGKDLDRAIGIFESIEKHPSTARASTSLPDAVVYEALFNVFSAHRRPDLIRVYLQRLRASHVHPTAYVANAAIKGYAATGEIDSARAMFEGLEDPPMGVAAPHNHTPHEPQRPPTEVPSQLPIYREPSTWETMVRAELGVNERERALDLIRRMDSRGYPPAVVQRVRDIMHTDTLGESPTPPPSESPISSN